MPVPLLKPNPFITPSRPVLVPGGTIQFAASLGSGSGYSWTMESAASGGSITGEGLYTAGATFNTVDEVKVTDSQGNESLRDVRVVPERSDGIRGGWETLSSLRQKCKQRTDLVNSTFIGDTEWNGYINESAQELYDRLIAAYANDYNVADPFIFQTDGITERYPLPPDFYKLLGCDVQVANTTYGWLPIARFNFGDRAKVALPYQTYAGVRSGFRYRLSGDSVWFQPTPAAGQYIQLLYVPRYTQLVEDTDVLDGVSGWEEYVVADVSIKAKTKRDEDATVFVGQKAGMSARIDSIAESRDAGAPGTVVDARAMENWEQE